MKNTLVAGLEDRQIKYLSETHEGQKHDKKILSVNFSVKAVMVKMIPTGIKPSGEEEERRGESELWLSGRSQVLTGEEVW